MTLSKSIVPATMLLALSFAVVGQAAEFEVLHGSELEIVTAKSTGSRPAVIRGHGVPVQCTATSEKVWRPHAPVQARVTPGQNR